MLNFVRPVGEPICLKAGPEPEAYSGYRMQLLGSGTMALQGALELAKSRSNVGSPEVILPAYACPDLISACVGASIKPVLVDLEKNSPFPSIRNIEAAISEQTIGLLLVNFLGISPPQKLFEHALTCNLPVIEDRAQGFVVPNHANHLKGDYVVFSFGKGKPVSLLGGGALLVKESLKPIEFSHHKNRTQPNHFLLKLKMAFYNLVINPFFYSLLIKIPGLSIGATRYKLPLPITCLDETRKASLSVNIKHQHKEHKQVIVELTKIAESILLEPLCNPKTCERLLRFPMLARNKQTRDALLQLLNSNGIGVSAMYNKPLPKLEGTPIDSDQATKVYPEATTFAERLLTLPCHSGVNIRIIQKIRDLLTNLEHSQH